MIALKLPSPPAPALQLRGRRVRRAIPRLLIAALIAFQASTPACRRRAAPPAAPVISDPVTLIGALDGTRSYEQIEEGRDQLAALINRVPPGSDVAIRWIAGDSYSSSCTIASASLPFPPSSVTNPFDQRGRAREAEQRRAVDVAREALLGKVATAPSPNARRTDIHGFLLHVAERRRSTPSRRIVVAIASDLDANVDTYRQYLAPGSLDGCAVVVLACAAPHPELRAAWERGLRSWGVVSVRFVAVGEPLPDDLFGGAK